jgi:dTDP-glucose 4,6-dehydratase
VLHQGRLGGLYNIGGEAEMANLDIVKGIVAALEKPESLIAFVTDRPGHDRRYAMRIDRIRKDVGWQPAIDFDAGLQATIEWYLQHETWWRPLLTESVRVADTMYKA